MTNYNTSAKDVTTDSARDAMIAGWAYNEGIKQGRILGAIHAMTPDEKNRGEFRQQEIVARLAEYTTNHATMTAARKYTRFWPALMPGGWPLPPNIPDDDEATWWPEVDGWPCPPPGLRGVA